MANNIQTTVKSWSSTLASNQPDGSDAFSNIADDLRAIQAAVRAWYEGVGWKDLGHTPTRTGNTTFTVTGDQTSFYTANLPIKCTDSTTLYGYVVSSAYTSLTTVTVALDSGNLSASLTAVAVGYDNQNGLIRHGVTPAADDSSTKLATTAYVQGELGGQAPLSSPTFTGTPAAPTAAPGTNTTQIATTAFVTAAVGGGSASAASQAQQETATATDVYVSPGRQQYHPSAAKFWVMCGVSGNITGSYNVSSVTDGGTGIATVVIANDFTDADYCCVATCKNESAGIMATAIDNNIAGSVDIEVRNSSGTLTDPTKFNAVGFGDQP